MKGVGAINSHPFIFHFSYSENRNSEDSGQDVEDVFFLVLQYAVELTSPLFEEHCAAFRRDVLFQISSLCCYGAFGAEWVCTFCLWGFLLFLFNGWASRSTDACSVRLVYVFKTANAEMYLNVSQKTNKKAAI